MNNFALTADNDSAVLILAVSAAFGLLFLAAGMHKLRDQVSFGAALADYDLLPSRLTGTALRLIPGVELLLGCGLLFLPLSIKPLGLVAAGVLLVLYTAAIAINLYRGRRHIDCGCGTASESGINGSLIARNLLLLALLLVTVLGISPAETTAVEFGLGYVLGVKGYLLYLAADQLRSNFYNGPYRRSRSGFRTQQSREPAYV